MLADDALAALTRSLASLLSSWRLEAANQQWGQPEQVERVAHEAERLFQGYAKAQPSKQDAYAAALAFLRGQAVDASQRDRMASALAEPIKERSNSTVLGDTRLDQLLAAYLAEAKQGQLWRLTWYGLLSSYFAFDPQASTPQANQGWQQLRSFLQQTWPWIDGQAGQAYVPDWIRVLRKETDVLAETPAQNYARDYLAGDESTVQQLAADLGIPPSSWFWHALVVGAVDAAANASDAAFIGHIPRLLQLIASKPAFRDLALETILTRYHQCRGAPPHEQLRDFVVQPTVWKNPKLRSAGMATGWNRVPEAVWQMVLGWVNERNLKDFFDILAARNNADHGRLAFWSQYLKQIHWTRLVFSADTMQLQRRDTAVRNLIAREEGAYAEMRGNQAVDAFIMRIGDYVAIEFSKPPNAAYVYRTDALKFNLYARHYDGDTGDLKYGFHERQPIKFIHKDGWDQEAKRVLKQLGIYSDADAPVPHSGVRRPAPPPATTRSSNASAPGPRAVRSTLGGQLSPRGASFTMASLEKLVAEFPGTTLVDKRHKQDGRLWIESTQMTRPLSLKLSTLGFKWSNKREAWYYPEP